jgi:hypothetical protein
MFAVEMLLLACALAFGFGAGQAGADSYSRIVIAARAGEAIATVRAGCAGCSWGEVGREAVVLRIAVDGRYSQHLALVRGERQAEYRVGLGPLSAGRHTIGITRDRDLSARDAGPATMSIASFDVFSPDSLEYTADSMAPILYARPNTVGKFTDLPILMWYEILPTARGRQFRYSVIFTNEDGGTATDRLMATWGRTTDIEYVYGVEVDERDRILAEEFQGPGHEVPRFTGRHEGHHPLLWVSTDNNMVSESGPTRIRYAPAAERFDLTDVSREAVMDRHAWSYAIAAAEMMREGKIGDDPAPNTGKIPDLRRYVFVEACTVLENAAVTFAIHAVEATGTARWFDADRGIPEFRVVRTGCFRGAVPLAPGAGAPDAIRFSAHARPTKDEVPPAPPIPVHLRRVNTIFMLGDDYLPRGSMLPGPWRGDAVLRAGEASFEIAFK